MVARALGKTGLLVTPIGFGAFKIGRNEGIKYPQGYELPDDAATERLLHGVLDLGIKFIDTAPAYGLSEERIGRFLSARRGEFVLSTKVGETFENGRSTYDFSADAIRASVARSLRRLRTDALDIVFVHANAGDVQILTQTDAVATLRELQQRGHVRAVGFSPKTVAAATLALESVDVLMVEYNALDTSQAGTIAAAAAKGVGVVVKKGLAGGRLPAERAIAAVFQPRGVDSLVVGGLDIEHLRENVRIAEQVLAAGDGPK